MLVVGSYTQEGKFHQHIFDKSLENIFMTTHVLSLSLSRSLSCFLRLSQFHPPLSLFLLYTTSQTPIHIALLCSLSLSLSHPFFLTLIASQTHTHSLSLFTYCISHSHLHSLVLSLFLSHHATLKQKLMACSDLWSPFSST